MKRFKGISAHPNLVATIQLAFASGAKSLGALDGNFINITAYNDLIVIPCGLIPLPDSWSGISSQVIIMVIGMVLHKRQGENNYWTVQ